MGFLSKFHARYADFNRIRSENDLWHAIRVALLYLVSNPYRALGISNRNYQQKRVDTKERWKIIERELDPDAENLLDIGCNEGEITKYAADAGLFSLGIERTSITVDEAERATRPRTTCYFLNETVDPVISTKLPEFDAMLLLTVFHHWEDQFGSEDAEQMFKDLCEKTNQLFFSIPKSDNVLESNRFREIENNSLVEKHREYLQNLLSKNAVIEHLATTDYMGGGS